MADLDGWAKPAQADGLWHYFQRHPDAYHSLSGNWTLELETFMYQGMDNDTHNCIQCRTLPRGI